MVDLSNKTIVFDGQVFQSTAWDRGMGKYSYNLLLAFSRSKSFTYKKAVILFSKNAPLPEGIEELLAQLGSKFETKFVDLQIPHIAPGEDINPAEAKNKKIIEKYISEFKPGHVDFMILSLMVDQYAAVFPDGARNILLFYDLIPLQYSEKYSKMWTYNNYLHRFGTILKADIILTISETVTDDLVVYTGMNRERIHSLVGGAIDRKKLKPKKPKSNLPKEYVLMPSGNDLRKNNFRAVQAFEEYRKGHSKDELALVITSHFDDKTKNDLLSLSNNVIFTNNVSEAELKWLYEHMEALLFVSEYEGLGLPILEAVEVDKPIACSNLTVFNEMSEDAFYYADEQNPASIAHALECALDRKDFSPKKAQYKEILERYTWDHTACQAAKVLQSVNAMQQQSAQKPKIAVFTPDPASYSAIGKVVMLSHYELSQYFEVEYYIEKPRSKKTSLRQSFLQGISKVQDARKFTARSYAQYQAVIYHIGNSEMHIESIKNALHLPGYLVMHDTRLNDVFEHELKKYSYINDARLIAERELESHVPAERASYLTSLVNVSLGVFVHSEYAYRAVESVKFVTNTPVSQLNLPVGYPELDKLKLNSGYSIGFAGIIHKDKGLSIVDKICKTASLSEVEIQLFGVPLAEPGELSRLESYSNVKVQENLTDFAFEKMLSSMDMIVNFRPNYNGETSLTVLEALRHGVVPIVRKVGWFDELPDDVVFKVETEDEVVAAIETLINDKQLLEHMQEQGKKYVASRHTYRDYAQKLQKVLKENIGNEVNRNIATMLQNNQPLDKITNFIK